MPFHNIYTYIYKLFFISNHKICLIKQRSLLFDFKKLLKEFCERRKKLFSASITHKPFHSWVKFSFTLCIRFTSLYCIFIFAYFSVYFLSFVSNDAININGANIDKFFIYQLHFSTYKKLNWSLWFLLKRNLMTIQRLGVG